mgnify:CR=1 FL=1
MNKEKKGRILALDYGRARIGVAISDPTHFLASPLPFLKKDQAWKKNLLGICKQYTLAEVLIGLPLKMNGQEGEMATEVRAFAKEVEQLLQMTPLFIDERLSSSQAEKHLKDCNLTRKERSTKLDSFAAALLLQAFLDKN